MVTSIDFSQWRGSVQSTDTDCYITEEERQLVVALSSDICIISQYSSRETRCQVQGRSAIKYERRNHMKDLLTSTGSERNRGQSGARLVGGRVRRV